MNKMIVTIEKQADGSYIAYNQEGEKATLIGTGETVKEAKEDFYNSMEEIRKDFQDCDDPVPADLLDEPVFHFDLSSLLEYYSIFNVSALGRYLGINPSLLRQYKSGNTPISDTQLEKIETGIHRLGKELASLSLI